MDGDTPIIRIFTLEMGNNVRYFTSFGTDYNLGYPSEHTKKDLVNLLENHPHLKEHNFVKYMNATIVHDELQKDLPNQEILGKKPKL